MQTTPVKSFQTKSSSLRAQIQNKLLTDKKLESNKENLKKFHSNIKNTKQNNFFSCQNQQSFSTTSMNEDNYENFREFQSSNKVRNECQITEKIILQYESEQNPYFFGYKQWQELNKKFFNQVDEKYCKNLWKIMRTINYGDALIPSGLIFQVVQCLVGKYQCSLKEIFNKFLSINNVSDRVNNFRELNNYLTFEQIQHGYNNETEDIRKKESSLKNSICEKLNNTYSQKKKNVFDRNYEEHKRRNAVKNKQLHQRLIQKQIDPQCLFKPKINEYCPKKLLIDESLKPSRACHSNSKWISERLTIDNDLTTNANFKATPFQRSRYQCKSIEQIPGATQHIDRYKGSEQKKRRFNRYNQRPTQVFKNY